MNRESIEEIIENERFEHLLNMAMPPDLEGVTFETAEDKEYFLISYYRWYPDLFLDVMTKEGGRRLNLYQRVLLRVLFRFKYVYTTIPRGSAKSFIQVLAYELMAVLYPGIKLSILAETKQQSASILRDKYEELLEWFPFLRDEILGKPQFQNDIAIIWFKNGSKIDNLANAQTTKGQRRTRGSVDEAARLNNEIWKDASEPVFSLRRYVGNTDIFDKRELHNQLLFFTTAGWKGTVEHKRSCDYVKDMINLQGKYVFGADYTLPVHFGLLSNRFVLDKKNDETTSPIAFAQNYRSIWVGAGSNQICDLDKIQAMRSEDFVPELKGDGYSEYIVSMDVARSESKSNNKSAYVVGKLIRNPKTKNISKVEIVNIVVLPNGHTFREQTLVLKELQMKYNAKMVVIDTSGIGKAIQDECLHEHVDFSKGVSYEAWDSINIDTLTPDVEGAKKMFYCINASGINHDIILNFWDYVENGKLQFLTGERNAKINKKGLTEQDKIDIINAHANTDRLLDELANLQAVETNNKKFTVKQITKRIDKDIYSALVYLLYYVQNFENSKNEKEETYEDYIFCSINKKENDRRRL